MSIESDKDEQHQSAMTHKHNIKCKCIESWIDSPIITHLDVVGKAFQNGMDMQYLKSDKGEQPNLQIFCYLNASLQLNIQF